LYYSYEFYGTLFGIKSYIALKIELQFLFGAGSGACIVFINFK